MLVLENGYQKLTILTIFVDFITWEIKMLALENGYQKLTILTIGGIKIAFKSK